MSQQSSRPSRSRRAAPGPGHAASPETRSRGGEEGAAGERPAGGERLQAWPAVVCAAAGEMPRGLRLPPRQPAGRRGWKQTPRLCLKVPQPWFGFFPPLLPLCFCFALHTRGELRGLSVPLGLGAQTASPSGMRHGCRQPAARPTSASPTPAGQLCPAGAALCPPGQPALAIPARGAGCPLQSGRQRDQAQRPERPGSSKPEGVGAGRGHPEKRRNPEGHRAARVSASGVHTPRQSGRKQDLYFSAGAKLTLPCNAPVPRLRGCSRDLSAPAGPGGRQDEDRRDQNQQTESCLLPVPLPHLPQDVSGAKAGQVRQETLANHSACTARTPAQPSPDPSRRRGIALASPKAQQSPGNTNSSARRSPGHGECCLPPPAPLGRGTAQQRPRQHPEHGSARPAGKQPAQPRLPDSCQVLFGLIQKGVGRARTG